VVACLRSAALVAAEGVQLVEQLSVEACVAQLDAVVEHLRVVERRMEKLLGEVCAAPPGSATAAWAPAATALLSMPGVGSKIAATVLAEAPEALRSADYPALSVLTALVSHGTTYDVARWPAPTRETALAG
jgi:transposase